MKSEETEKRIHEILSKPTPPTPKEQRFIDNYLDRVRGELKRKERLERAESYEIDTEHFLSKRNRIHKRANRLSDYKNTKGNKERVRHPSKFKRLEGVFITSLLFYERTPRDTLEVMKTAYIFHDSFSDPFGEWYPWMKTILEGMGYLVVVPKFPSPAGQSYESWKVVIKNYINTFNEETLLIGHGTGALFAMRLTQDSTVKLRGLFLVAAYGGPIGNIGYDRVNKTFYEPALNWQQVIAHASIIRIYAGAGDPFVPESATAELEEHLNEAAQIIPDGGHLNKAAGFSELVVVASGIKDALAELDRSIAIESSPDGSEEIAPTDIKSIQDAAELIAGKPLERHTEVAPLTRPTSTTTVSATSSQHPLSQEAPATSATTTTSPIAPPEQPIIHPHTMYQDLSKIVQSNRGKVASSLLTKARVEKAEQEAASPASGQNIIYTILSIIILAATFGIIVFLVQKYAPTPVTPPAPEVASLLRAEEHDRITFSTEPSFIIDQKIKNLFEKPLTDGTIRDIYYVTNGARASFNSLLKVLNVTDLPPGLTAEFPESANGLPVFMHGLSVKNQVAQHFLVLRVNNYDTTFSLMKAWEPLMARHLGPLMNISSDYLRTKLTKDVFTDEMIQNKAVRTLRYQASASINLNDNSTDTPPVPTAASQAGNAFADAVSPYQPGDLILAYFFLNEKTVIITDNLELIPELLKRYADRQIYQ